MWWITNSEPAKGVSSETIPQQYTRVGGTTWRRWPTSRCIRVIGRPCAARLAIRKIKMRMVVAPVVLRVPNRGTKNLDVRQLGISVMMAVVHLVLKVLS